MVLCLLHGVFRPRSIGSKASRASAEAKAGFTIEVRACVSAYERARFRGEFLKNSSQGIKRRTEPPHTRDLDLYAVN